MRTFDIDGVICMGNWVGVRPSPVDIIITGRSFEEANETDNFLQSHNITNKVYYNPVKFEDKTRSSSGKHKARIIKQLQEEGKNIRCHFEDDEIQAKVIEHETGLPVVLLKHNLVNRRTYGVTLTVTKSNPYDYIDHEMVKDIGFFWNKVLEAFDYRAGLIDTFEAAPGIDWDTEYFGPNVTMDERLRYVGANLASNPNISDTNRVLNVLITHFYGGLEIHRVLNAEKDPKKAYTDFERIASGDREYVKQIRTNLDKAMSLGYKPWSSNELHTSLQGAAHKYVESQGHTRHTSAVTEWLAGWVTDGTTDQILNCKTLKECVGVLTSKPGIGPYYGYHGATDQSTNPSLPFNHDEAFVLAGLAPPKPWYVSFPV